MHCCLLILLIHWPLWDLNEIVVIVKLIVIIDEWSIFCKTALRGMSRSLTDNEPTVDQLMAWCCSQATKQCPTQCWYGSMPMYGVTWPPCVEYIANTTNGNTLTYIHIQMLTKQPLYIKFMKNWCSRGVFSMKQQGHDVFVYHYDHNNYHQIIYLTRINCFIQGIWLCCWYGQSDLLSLKIWWRHGRDTFFRIRIPWHKVRMGWSEWKLASCRSWFWLFSLVTNWLNCRDTSLIRSVLYR